MEENILKYYLLEGDVVFSHKYGNGHINKTYLIVTKANKKYIFQQINHNAFKKPKNVMKNIKAVTNHIRDSAMSQNEDPQRAALEIIPTKRGKNYLKYQGTYWRCYRYIEGAKTYEKIENPDMFYEVGKTIGKFQNQLKNFRIKKLKITIPDFHNTPKRFIDFINSVNNDICKRGMEVLTEIDFICSRYKDLDTITSLMDNSKIPIRVTHNDTKLNNVMIDEITNKAICVIDLDTVMPGSLLYDFADAIRVGAATAKEDETELEKITIDLLLFKKFSQGFLEETYTYLTKDEIENLVESCRIITLECGMRFLTDYLSGDNYFKTEYELHNLDRARAQFKLVQEIEKKYHLMQEIVEIIIKKLK